MSIARQSVCAVVVTRDRRELLRECLAAVTGQTRPPDHVLVVDNAGSDGSADMVARDYPAAELLRLEHNEGGAGGFHEGMRRGAEGDWTWLWIMDDDTIPATDALEQLLEAPGRLEAGAAAPSLLASKVVWTDGRLHPMNQPRLRTGDADALIRGMERGVVPLRLCTFPSLLVRRTVIARHGLPHKEFFIWSDDIDFTGRVLRHEPGYFVPASVAVHKTAAPSPPSAGGDRFFYAVRNGLWVLRGRALEPKERPSQVVVLVRQIGRYLAYERWSRRALVTVTRGLVAGLGRAPG